MPNPDTDKGDPTQSLMDMMKNLYQTGDDDMKKVIAESWQKAQAGDKTPLAPTK